MRVLFSVGLGACLWVGCSSGSESDPERVCATDIEAGAVQDFAQPTPSNTEGIVFDLDGTLYVSAQDPSAPDRLLEILADGSSRSVAESESILGLESDSRGIVAAAINSGEVLLIDPADGSSELITDAVRAPNFVVTTPWDTILVSDDTPGEDSIYEVTWDGDLTTWVTGIPTPNGMVFSLDETVLYVAATFDQPGLWRIPVSADGDAGTPERWVEFDAGTTPDGVAIDSEGSIYVALNLAGEIAKVDPAGNVTTLASDVQGVASLAFGRGERDPCSLSGTNLFGTQMFRVGAGVLGAE